MKVIVVSQYYAPEDARIPTRIATELSKRGHTVDVITAFPSYPYGQIYPGYRQRLRHVELTGGVRVRRLPSILNHSSSAAGRIASYLSFAISSTLAGREARSADVVYVYATQMTAALGPVLWRILGGPPYVLHIQDLWPESVTHSAMIRGATINRSMAAIMTPLLRFAYRRSAAVLAIAPTMREILTTRGAGPEQTTVVLNWADERQHPRRTTAPTPGRTSVVYAGNIGPLQELELAIAAAATMNDADGFTLTIVGSGVAEESVRASVQQSGACNVKFVGRVPKDKMADIYSLSDFQLVTLKDLPIFRGTIPSKVPESLRAGIPLLTNIAGDVASMVATHQLGLVCKPGSVDALASAFRSAHAMSSQERDSIRQRCLSYYSHNMTLERGIDAVESTLRAATSVNVA